MSVPALAFGKRMPGATYAARCSLERLGGAIWSQVQRACEQAGCRTEEIDVVKWHHDSERISLLQYPGFLGEPHPALRRSLTLDQDSGELRETSYGEDSDPPILHRCELLVEPDHPVAPKLRVLTRIEERFGLYADSARIGLRSHWNHALEQRGLRSEGFSLRLSEMAGRPVGAPVEAWLTERQRTAIRRPSLSLPPRLLLERDLLKRGDSYFDYGCGHGLDLPLLEQLGIQVHAWDPAHRPGAPKRSAAVVHCGYVLNVVEDPEERSAIIRDAWSYTERLLSISVRVRAAEASPSGTSYGDGELTRSGTFQRYFSPDELPALLREVLDQPLLSLAPGIVVVARDASVLHEAMAARVRTRLPTIRIELPQEEAATGGAPSMPTEAVPGFAGEIASAPKSRRLGPRQRRLLALFEEVGPLLRELGRAPRPEEWQSNLLAQELALSPLQVWNAYAKEVGPAAIAALEERRRTDALVFLAMAHFRRIPSLGELPLRTRLDIEDLCGGHRSAVAAAKACLTQAGNPDVIAKLCNEAGVGICDEQALYLHSSLLSHLHPVLRCYVGCAEVLGAPLGTSDLIKIHKRSRKVSLLVYQDFDHRPLPALIERIKVDIRAQTVLVFDHRTQPRQLLYDKDLYLAEDDPRRSPWQAQGERLAKLIGPVKGRGPDHLALRELLQRAGGQADEWVPESFPAPVVDDFDEEEEVPAETCSAADQA